jgi:hypothetical protein
MRLGTRGSLSYSIASMRRPPRIPAQPSRGGANSTLPGPGDLAYVLPLRWQDDGGLPELTAYLRWLSDRAEVIVVDSSPPAVFGRHRAAFGHRVRHLPPDADLRCRNGKVSNVLTGLRHARYEHVIVADDDVRYDADGLTAVVALLASADLVRPQNYFDPAPWHARWDTARTLLNRGLGGADYPGTFGLRRGLLRQAGGYDGDVLFENLELIRTVRAWGGVEAHAPGIYVRRLPPDPSRFWAQRVRQAYDDLAQPARLTAVLALGPVAAVLAARGPRWPLAAGVGLSVALAELGRRRAGGRAFFRASASLFAPAWLAERAVCGWLAVSLRIRRGGVSYAGHRIKVAANPQRVLNAKAAIRRREQAPAPFADRDAAIATPGPEPCTDPDGAT